MSFLERQFELKSNGTTVRREITAGLTTFAAMAYILAVNPQILSLAGIPAPALVTVTALASAITTVLMALMTNYPLALAPGMGLNAFFTFSICLHFKVPWQSALGLVFIEGLLFLLLSVTGVRRKIVEAIPYDLKLAVTCGIGLFIAFIGLRNGGIIVSDPATFVTLGKLSAPAGLLTLFGIILTAILIYRKVPGAIIVSILVVTLIGLAVPDEKGGRVTSLPEHFFSIPASIAPTFLKLDLTYFFKNLSQTLPLVFALLFVDLFDNMGTLIGVCQKAGLLDARGNLPKIGRALTADASAAMIGACLGTSTTTSYIESAAGVEEGGRTGLTSIVVALCFLLALFLSPIILAIPAVATAPALVIVGVFMMQGIAEINLKDFAIAAPAVLTILVMPLAFSISEGIAIGFVVYAALMVGIGRARQVSAIAYALAALFLLHFFLRS